MAKPHFINFDDCEYCYSEGNGTTNATQNSPQVAIESDTKSNSKFLKRSNILKSIARKTLTQTNMPLAEEDIVATKPQETFVEKSLKFL